MDRTHVTVQACQSASRLACTHPMLGALIPLGLILAVLIGSGLACWASGRRAATSTPIGR